MPTHRILIVGATSERWETIAADVQTDLDRLARPSVEPTYRRTGAGPAAVRSRADATAATPHVIASIRAAAADGFDAVVVDCTDDPGVAEARDVVPIPVVGPGGTLGGATRQARQPVVELSGEAIRHFGFDELTTIVGDAPTIAIGGTGHSAIAGRLANLPHHPTVLEPLELALEECVRALELQSEDSATGAE